MYKYLQKIIDTYNEAIAAGEVFLTWDGERWDMISFDGQIVRLHDKHMESGGQILFHTDDPSWCATFAEVKENFRMYTVNELRWK